MASIHIHETSEGHAVDWHEMSLQYRAAMQDPEQRAKYMAAGAIGVEAHRQGHADSFRPSKKSRDRLATKSSREAEAQHILASASPGDSHECLAAATSSAIMPYTATPESWRRVLELKGECTLQSKILQHLKLGEEKVLQDFVTHHSPMKNRSPHRVTFFFPLNRRPPGT